MNRPSIPTYLIGNPLALVAILGGGGWCLYQWWHGLAPPMAALIAVTLMAWSGKANRALSDYADWQRCWKAIAPAASPNPLSHPAARRMLAGIVVLAVGYYLAAHQTSPGYQLALGWLILGVLCFIGVWLLRGLYRLVRRRLLRRTQPKAVCVTLCMPRPAETVPTLAQAYQQLPEHCWRVLKR